MALHWTLFVALNLDTEELFAGPKIPHLKAQHAVNVHENQRVASVYGERTNHVVEGPHGTRDRVCRCVCHEKKLGVQASQIDVSAIKSSRWTNGEHMKMCRGRFISCARLRF
jgi:hypothetical protein